MSEYVSAVCCAGDSVQVVCAVQSAEIGSVIPRGLPIYKGWLRGRLIMQHQQHVLLLVAAFKEKIKLSIFTLLIKMISHSRR